MKLFQINEDDLAELDHVLPELFAVTMTGYTDDSAPRVRKQMRRVQEIISRVRWDYGPWSEVEKIDPPMED